MASGMSVTDTVKQIYEEMKVHRCNDDPNNRIRVATFTIQNNEIEVDRLIRESDLCGCDAYEKFLEQLKEEDCTYALYDCHYEMGEGIKKEDLVFVTWIPDCCKIKPKMVYAASKNSLKKIFADVKCDLQINDPADCKNREAFAGKIEKDAVTMEGKPVHCSHH